MSLCAACGLERLDGAALCPQHDYADGFDDWAEGNRVICDWIHRGKVPVRLAPDLREEPVGAG